MPKNCRIAGLAPIANICSLYGVLIMATRQHIFIILIVALGLISAVNCGDKKHPSDSVLEMNFHKHETDFQRLVSMSNEDYHVVRIGDDFNWLDDDHRFPRTGPERGLSKDRWDSYRALFQELGLKCGLIRWEDSNIIALCASGIGMVTSGTTKGYAYSETELTPTAESLDVVPENLKDEPVVYKSIEPHWYLYYQ